MSSIGEPIRRHEVVPIETTPIKTPEGPKAPIKEPIKEPEKVE